MDSCMLPGVPANVYCLLASSFLRASQGIWIWPDMLRLVLRGVRSVYLQLGRVHICRVTCSPVLRDQVPPSHCHGETCVSA